MTFAEAKGFRQEVEPTLSIATLGMGDSIGLERPLCDHEGLTKGPVKT